MTSPDPDPGRVPGLEPGQGVAPGDTPPSDTQTSGVRHLEEGPGTKTTNGWLIAIVVIIVLIVAGAVAAAISLLV